MNNYDCKIIERLMLNARTTWAELGQLLGLSAPAAAERVRKLEEAGVIKSYTALVDPAMAGCGLGALIAVVCESRDSKEYFLHLVKNLPEILECHHIAGADDYVLKVRCADTGELENLISDKIKAVAGIRTQTTVILSTIKETCVLPLKVSR